MNRTVNLGYSQGAVRCLGYLPNISKPRVKCFEFPFSLRKVKHLLEEETKTVPRRSTKTQYALREKFQSAAIGFRCDPSNLANPAKSAATQIAPS